MPSYRIIKLINHIIKTKVLHSLKEQRKGKLQTERRNSEDTDPTKELHPEYIKYTQKPLQTDRQLNRLMGINVGQSQEKIVK